MEEKLISLETAKLAKEKGFDEEVSYAYNVARWRKDNDLIDLTSDNPWKYNSDPDNTDEDYLISAPTQSLLQKWLREIFNIHINITFGQEKRYMFSIVDIENCELILEKGFYSNYEEALEDALLEALNQIKSK